LGEIVALTEAEAQRREVYVQTRLESKLPSISADRVQLQQVLLNLVMNSMDAAERGYRADRAKVTIEAKQESGGGVCVAVQDTGAGIDPGREKELFEPFFHHQTRRFGLGISIKPFDHRSTRRTLTSHTNDGPGVRFSFTLPGGGPCGP